MRILVAVESVDFRKGIEGLVQVSQEPLGRVKSKIKSRD
jgi:hypothetical protein